MSAQRPITRRAFVRAAVLGAGGLALAGCIAPAISQPASPSPAPPKPATEPPATATPNRRPTHASPTAAPEPLRRRIARLLLVGFRGLTVGADDPIARAIAGDGLGGVILFDRDEELGVRNVQSAAQVARLVADLRALAPDRELIVAIDQEGGRVTRLSPKYGFPAVESEAAIGRKGETSVQTWADGIATTLAGVGINLNFAPVDLNVNPKNPAIGALDRAFSADAAVVSRGRGGSRSRRIGPDGKTALKSTSRASAAPRRTRTSVSPT